VRLFLLRLIGAFKPTLPKAILRRVRTLGGLGEKSWRTKEDYANYKDPNEVSASPRLVEHQKLAFMKSSGWPSISERKPEQCENMVKNVSVRRGSLKTPIYNRFVVEVFLVAQLLPNRIVPENATGFTNVRSAGEKSVNRNVKMEPAQIRSHYDIAVTRPLNPRSTKTLKLLQLVEASALRTWSSIRTTGPSNTSAVGISDSHFTLAG